VNQPEDAELVRQAQAGDLSAFDQLVLRHQAAVYRYLYRMTRNSGDAEELTQQAFVRAWQGLARFRGQASFRTWLFRIATNLCFNHLTRRRPFCDLPETLAADPAVEPDQLFRRKVQQTAIEAALARLPADQRSALIFSVYDQMSYAEVADAMGRSLASVNALLYRARMALRRHLAEARRKGLV